MNFDIYNKIVIKIGSSLLVDSAFRFNWLASLATNIINLKAQGKQVIIVTSGAVALGKLTLKLMQHNISVPQKQALASIGQIELMLNYKQAFAKQQIAQILVTANDCNVRTSYLNCQKTIQNLLHNNIIPIINENDSIATQEIKFGDNDRLAARIAQMCNADLLILLSDIDGLYNKNPKIHNDAFFIDTVTAITTDIISMAQGTSSAVGTGGMITKIMAAKMATQAGCATIITDGREDNCLQRLWQTNNSPKKFTNFVAKCKNNTKNYTSRKKWLQGIVNPKGEIIINDCAVNALQQKKVSLLAIGAIAVYGNFLANDVVLIKDSNNNIIGGGIINHSSIDTAKILQKNSLQIKQILGDNCKTELIHLDNLVVYN